MVLNHEFTLSTQQHYSFFRDLPPPFKIFTEIESDGMQIVNRKKGGFTSIYFLFLQTHGVYRCKKTGQIDLLEK